MDHWRCCPRKRRLARLGHCDRGIDLAAIMADVEDSFGAEWVEPFLQSYGTADWDPANARFFSDLYELFR